MAKLSKSPVILVIDSRGVTRKVTPLVLGYQHFYRDVLIAGVIYNFCGGARHEQKLRAVTEEYTVVPVLGMLRKSTSMDLAERHLGLMPSNENKDAKQRISEIARFVTCSVDFTKVLQCADTEPEPEPELVNKEQLLSINTSVLKNNNSKLLNSKKVRIGICEDAAFGFYYADDKQALIETGAE